MKEHSSDISGEETLPTSEQLKTTLERETFRLRYNRTIRSMVSLLITVAAVAVLIASLLLPTFRIYGDSMAPTVEEGEVVVSVRTSDFSQGDLVAFYYNNKILVKRVIAKAGEWVNIDEDGNVIVNDHLLDEPYLQEKALGECDIEFPYQVPDGRLFVLGDHRSISVDSRNSEVGCISSEQIAGKLVLRVWPFRAFGRIG